MKLLSEELLRTMEPNLDDQQIMHILKLQEECEMMRTHLKLCQPALEESIAGVRMAFQENRAIAEENQQLREVLAQELGELPACWYDTNDEMYSHQFWESSLTTVTQKVQQAFLVLDEPPYKNHDLLTLHKPITETSDSSNTPAIATRALVHSESVSQSQASTLQEHEQSNLAQIQRVPGLPSPVGVMEIPVLPSSPSYAHVDHSQSVVRRTATQIHENSSELSLSSIILNSSPSCPRVSHRQCPMNFLSNPRTMGKRASNNSQWTTSLGLVTDDDPGESDSQGVDSGVQGRSNPAESGQRVAGVSVVEEEVPDQPSPNSHPRLRILPPVVTTLVVRNLPARFSPQKLLEVWPPDGTYNLLYVPYNMVNRSRLGFAFINMTSHEAAAEFMARWHGQKLVNERGVKRLDIIVAETQGFMQNLQRLKASKIDKIRNETYLPLLFLGKRKLDSQALLASMDLGVINTNELEQFVVDPVVT